MLSCIIIDDEQACLDTLKAIIKFKLGDRLTVLSMSDEGLHGAELIRGLQPDIVFLDVEMPGFTGLQLLSLFPDRNFSVVFTTAHPGYALDALKNEATDYLLKPISAKELEVAVAKCEKRKALLQPANASTDRTKKISLPSSKGSLLVGLEEIIRFESCNNYSTVYFTERPKLVVARTLKIFDDQLSRNGFFRIHQSHLVNIAHITSYLNGDVSYAVLSNGDKVEISRRRKSEFLKAIKLS